MDDDRVWALEKGLWVGGIAQYREVIDDECVMVLPVSPFVFTGERAVMAVVGTPCWTKVELSERQITRPQDGLIAIAYKAVASREGSASYAAFCTTTMRRLKPDVWRVVQHQQMLPPAVSLPK